MIKFENTEVIGWEAAIHGIHNPINSWEKSDSGYCMDTLPCHSCKINRNNCKKCMEDHAFIIGPNDYDLMKRLRNAGTNQCEFIRMITVCVDITAPLYWWDEFNAYKCSPMDKIYGKEFALEDFSCEHLISDWIADNNEAMYYYDTEVDGTHMFASPKDGLNLIIGLLNSNRQAYLKTKDKKYWWQMVQLLPSSYNQKRTVMLTYEELVNIYKSRKNHKLDEWSEHSKDKIINNALNGKFGFCDWIKTLPCSELITDESLSDIPICNAIMEEAKKRVREGEE